MKPLVVLVTGDPVPRAEQRRGGFFEMVQRTAAGSWPGPWRAYRLDTLGSARFEALPDPLSLAGCIITGSAAMLSERSHWMLYGEEYLRKLIAAQRPVLGICFGHQMLAQALGGHVGRNPRGREIGTVGVEPRAGWSDITTRSALTPASTTAARDRTLPASAAATDPLWSRVPALSASLPSGDGATANMTHLESALRLPAGAEVLASSVLEPYAAVRFAATAWGVQFHPEFDREVMQDYIEARREKLHEEGLDPDQLASSARDTPWASALVEAFAGLVQQDAVGSLDDAERLR